MIHAPDVTKSSIRRHYDLLSPFYRLLWGEHIHHGLWDEQDTAFALPAQQAQLRLTETLADLVQLAPGERIVDIGCGLGGSAIHLASSRHCHVTGVTLSGVQRLWATAAARRRRVGHLSTGKPTDSRGATEFLRADAETVAFPIRSFDLLWSVECTEHLFDKPAFFRRSAEWIRPGGRLALCAWTAGEAPLTPEQQQTALEVCEGMFCPSLGSASDYTTWFAEAGWTDITTHDWTARVARTWELCQERVRRSGTGRIAPLLGRDAVLFLSRFQTMLDAYANGAMRYTAFTARREG